MKSNFIVFCLCIFITLPLAAQDGMKEFEKEKNSFDVEKILRIEDRAGGTHNASNIGLFFENRGKLYPRRITQGPSGEFPINSGNHYIYRLNPFVGIPGNVIQGRYTTNEEWEAAYGYQNPDLAQIAFSDNPATWDPNRGWPINDSNGDPLFFSDQDSYCAYNDSNNTVKILGLQINQIGYAYGVSFASNLLFYKYEIVNNSSNIYDSLYFSNYVDLDLGNISGGTPEYEDDKLGFDKGKNFVYFYDSDSYSPEWPDGNVGMMGVAFLKTPEVNGDQLGLTDFHYNIYNDDRDIDTVQYGIMSSASTLFNSSFGGDYFHLGANPDLHFDDTTTIPSGGLDILANISSGPYEIHPGDTLVFYTVIVAGETKDGLFQSLDEAYKILDFNFEIAKAPSTPTLTAVSGNNSVNLYWDDEAENSLDNFSGEYDFEGYRVYRSVDKGITWTLLADFDIINDIGLDRGLQYSYTDIGVVNGIEYWYSVTAYDRGGDALESLESSKGSNADAKNLEIVIPVSTALGRTPVSSEDVIHSTGGLSNYVLDVLPADLESLAENNYDIGFSFISKTEKGKLKTQLTYEVVDSSRSLSHRYGIAFKINGIFDIVDLTTGDVLREDINYTPRAFPGALYSSNGSIIPGIEIHIYDPNPSAPIDSLPAAGDLLTLNFAVNTVKNSSDSVIANRPFMLDKIQATTDGVAFTLTKPEIIQNVSRIGGVDDFNIEFSVSDESLVENALYIISVEGSGYDSEGSGIISLSIKTDSVIAEFDSLTNLDSFEFNGISGSLEFPNDDPPSPGNIFSVETIVPVEPNILDGYLFKIKGAVINSETVSQDINKIRVVPNPYVVSSLFEPEFGELRREPLRQIQFVNLPSECTIHIFSVNADLVKTLYHNSTNGTETWDLRSESGREIAPGVYIYVVKSSDAEFMERFAVIK